ncbi:hypothetical protein QNM99_04315 [Pseudomonas sp. PCH446]
MKELQETALSQHTPATELFKVLDEVSDTWKTSTANRTDGY